MQGWWKVKLFPNRAQFGAYCVSALIGAWLLGLFFTSNWKEKGHYTDPKPFVGCYEDERNNLLELAATSEIIHDQTPVGK